MDTSERPSMPVPQYRSVTAQTMTGVLAPTMNYGMAFQLPQNPFLNQQLLLQQPTVAISSVSIEAAAKQAAARAAEISRLLEGDDNVKQEKTEEIIIKRPGSQSPPSKSKPESPVRYRSSRGEHDKYSPRESSRYRGYRRLGYYVCGYDGKERSRSGYRRYDDHYHGRDYSYCRGSSRSRRRSHSRTRYLRHYHSHSHSRRHQHSQSPSSDDKIAGRALKKDSPSASPARCRRTSSSSRSGHRISPRDSNGDIASRSPIKGSSSRHGTSQSPIKSRSTSLTSKHKISASDRGGSSSSGSPVRSSRTSSSSSHSRSTSPKKSVTRMTLSSSRNTQDGSLSSISAGDSRRAKYRSSGLDTDSERRIKEMPCNKCLKEGDIPGSYSTFGVAPVDHSRPNPKIAASVQFASASRSCSSYSRNLEKRSTPRAVGPINDRSDLAVSSPQIPTNDMDNPLLKVDHQLCRKREDVDGRHDEMGILRGEKSRLNDPIAEKRVKQSSIKPLSSKGHSLSPGGSYLEKGSWENASDNAKVCTDIDKYKDREMCPSGESERESLKVHRKTESDLLQKAKSSMPYPLGLVMDNKSEVDMGQRKRSEDMVTENFVNRHDYHTTNSHCHKHSSFPDDVAGSSLLKLDENMVDRIRTPVRLPGVPWVETAEAVGSQLLYCYPEERPKQRSMSWEKRRKQHGKRHRRDESQEDECRRDNEREQKLKEHHRGRGRHHKKGSERKTRQ